MTLVWFLVVGCAATKLDPVRGPNFEPLEDEAPLWKAAAALDAELEKRGIVYEDPILHGYLTEITDALLRQMGASGASVRARVLREPFLNAFALPNGSLHLHSGLLAKIENEAQLATVLGHELAHYLYRHSIRSVRNARNQRSRTAALFGSLVFVIGGLAPPLAEVFAEDLIRSQVNGYSRDLEREADRLGLEAVLGAGYDGSETVRVFEILRTEDRNDGVEERYFLGSHPRLEERIESYTELLERRRVSHPAKNSQGRRDAARYGEAVVTLLLENARLDLELGRPKRSRDAIRRHLTLRPDSAAGHALLGDSYRSRLDRPEAVRAAIDAYHQALRLDSSRVDLHRELGLLYRAQGRRDEALTTLGRYLELVPDALDRPIIEGYCAELEAAAGQR